jgi:hypothetical protein
MLIESISKHKDSLSFLCCLSHVIHGNDSRAGKQHVFDNK